MPVSTHAKPSAALVTCALATVLIAAGACGGWLRPVKSSGPPQPNPAAARIMVVQVSVQVKSGAPTTQVSATCPQNSQMIGGGFVASDVFEYDALVTANYPDPHDGDLRTWTAIAGPSGAFTLGVEAYCLNQGPDLQISLHAQTGRSPYCPSQQTPLGAGFRGEFENGTYYVLCASQHATGGGVVFQSFNPQSSSHGYAPRRITLTCASGALAISGDEGAGVDSLLASYSAGPPYLSWVIGLGGDKDVTVSTTCVKITAGA